MASEDRGAEVVAKQLREYNNVCKLRSMKKHKRVIRKTKLVASAPFITYSSLMEKEETRSLPAASLLTAG